MTTEADEMAISDDIERDGVPGSGIVDEAPQSILDQLRVRRDEVAKTKPYLLMDVPGYEERLWLRLQYPAGGYQALVKAADTAQSKRDPVAAVNAACDTVMACTDTLLGQREDGVFVHLNGEQPVDVTVEILPRVRFQPDFAASIGIVIGEEVRSPGRFIVREVFSPRAQETGEYDGDVALLAFGGRIMRWLQNTSQEVAEDFAGG